MENNSQILQLCRLCLDKDSVNIPIFEEPGDIRQIYLKISSCLPVKVSRDDRLPKKICDGCSHKLDLVYEFRNTSVSAEKQLLEWLDDTNLISETVAKSTQHSLETNTQQNRPSETQVKQEEIDPSDIQKEEDEDDDKNYLFEQSFQDSSAAPGPSATTDVAEEEEEEPPPPKRAKRTAAVKAAIAMDQSDDDDEDDLGEPLTKVEDESDESEGDDQEAPFVDVPSTSADDQPGPSGVGKEGEAPYESTISLDAIEGKVEFSEGGDFKKIKCCDVCGKFFKNNRRLKKHLISHSEERPHACSICHRRFKRKHEVKNHLRVHNGNVSFECDFCLKKLRSKASWIAHRKRHMKEYIVKCEICGHGFVTTHEHKAHMNLKHGYSKFICNICGRRCYDKNSLEGHMARHAADYGTPNPNIKCELCNKTFLQERYLKHHYIRMHKDGGQRFMCDLCGKYVQSKVSLRDHMLTHEGIKPIECKECGKSFVRRTTLKLHMRTHTGERPHTCQECGKSFTQRGPLKTHMLYHTGERPYKCEICSMGFVTRHMMLTHVKKFHDTV